MKVFLDTNVIVDFYGKREPNFEFASDIIALAKKGMVDFGKKWSNGYETNTQNGINISVLKGRNHFTLSKLTAPFSSSQSPS